MHGTARPQRSTRAAKMTIKVYTVTPEGIVPEPRACVSVPHDYVPAPEGLGTQLPPCDCPRHSKAGTTR